MEFQNIRLDREGKLAFLTISRPEVRNALNRRTMEEMRRALQLVREDPAAGCLVITGAGEKAFAAGADIGELRERGSRDALKRGVLQELFDEIESFEKPTIAMVNGLALGGGCELAMACDLRVAAEHAGFGLPELNLGIIPGAGGTQRLTRLVGKGRALEMILTGRIVPAAEAERIGLCSRVVPFSELKPTVTELADKILSKGPLAVRYAKLAVNCGGDADMRTALLIERLAQALLYDSADKREGVDAFLEKRKPNFTGN